MWERSVRGLAAALVAGGCSACVPSQSPTPPGPGTRVVVDFYPSRHIDVPVTKAATLAYEHVIAVDGLIARTSGDTVWLRDVGVKVGDRWSWPNPREALAVPGINRSATIHRASSELVTVGGLLVGSAIAVAAVVVATFWFGLKGPSW